MASTSVICDARTVTVQVSPCVKSAVGSSVNVALGLALVENACEPEVAQEIVKLDPLAFTGSLKLTVTFAFAATPVALFVGVVVVTAGDDIDGDRERARRGDVEPPLAVPPLSRRRTVMFVRSVRAGRRRERERSVGADRRLDAEDRAVGVADDLERGRLRRLVARTRR